jgi:hypothetical protein
LFINHISINVSTILAYIINIIINKKNDNNNIIIALGNISFMTLSTTRVSGYGAARVSGLGGEKNGFIPECKPG